MLLTYCYRNAYNIKVVILTFDAKTRNKRVNNPIRVFSCLVNKRLGLGNVGAVGGWVLWWMLLGGLQEQWSRGIPAFNSTH